MLMSFIRIWRDSNNEAQYLIQIMGWCVRQTGDLQFGLGIIYNVLLLLYHMLKNKFFFFP